MHYSQFRHMKLSVDKYMPTDRHLTVLELGSRNNSAELRTHRELMGDRDVEYVGIDLKAGHNVDKVMRRPYTFPVASRSVDFLISGAVFEHIPFFWSSMLEIGRVLKPGGMAFVLAPSRGHVHNVYDCWRFYPDGHRALAAWSKLRLDEVFTDLPPTEEESTHHDYTAIDTKTSYWGDSIGIYRKPARGYPERRMAVLRRVIRWYANGTPNLEKVPLPELDPRRRKVHRWG